MEFLFTFLVLGCFHFVFFSSLHVFPPASDKLLLAWREMEQAVELCGRVGGSLGSPARPRAPPSLPSFPFLTERSVQLLCRKSHFPRQGCLPSASTCWREAGLPCRGPQCGRSGSHTESGLRRDMSRGVQTSSREKGPWIRE